jgi:sec-independent protein translocase protein TatA
MGGLSLVHWLLFGGVAVLLLGGGRFSNMAGDVAKGIKQFKKGMAEEDEPTRLDSKKPAEPVVDIQAEKLREDR